MRLLVFGSRDWDEPTIIEDVLLVMNSLVTIETIIEGEAKGADIQARDAADRLGIPVMRFPAEWNRYGRMAGPIRNQKMIDEGKPDAGLGFHHTIERSKGSKDMRNRLEKVGIPVWIIN